MQTVSPPEWTTLINIPLIVSTYRANKLLTISNGAINSVQLAQPKGVYYKSPWLRITTWNNVWTYREYTSPEITKQVSPDCDVVFIPKRLEETGDIGSREIAGESIAAAKLSCLVTVDDYFSVRPIWKPKWIDRIIAEDRCHVNGIALDQNFGLAYVTALGTSNKKDGWRTEPVGGCIIDAKSGLVITSSLRMPHSPRLYQGKLWVCDSMRGELSVIDVKTKKRHAFVRFPEFVRGLAFWQDWAIVGLSRIRRIENNDIAICGIAAVNLNSGKVEAVLPLDADEIFDVQVLPFKNPVIVDPRSDILDSLLVLPENLNLNKPKRSSMQ
ncbi:DUF4915 domain-containing protein [Microcoleus sp. herbarium7]|uniref:DUF4915 domain-containing protein n=1 Tax=Microcoleus sp. herbarium7 TaxID=3055435 RepID=UPI002FD053C3